MSAYVHGFDISHWDGTIVWTDVPELYKFAFIKFSEGSKGNYWQYEDKLAWQHWLGAGQNGLYRSPYHFWRYYGGSGLAQATYFKEMFDKNSEGSKVELPPVVDLEDIRAPQRASDIKYRIREMLDNTERLFGVQPIIYTARWWTEPWIGDCSWLAGYKLWVARYTYTVGSPVTPTDLPRGWVNWTFWQWTDQAEIPGVAENDECSDVFQGTLAQLSALAVNQPPVHVPTLEEKVALLWDAHPELHGG